MGEKPMASTITVTGGKNFPINDEQTATPFQNASITLDGTATVLTIDITFSGNGGGIALPGELSLDSPLGGSLTRNGDGEYTYAATAPLNEANINSDLQAIVFTPTRNQVDPGNDVVTSFELEVDDGLDTDSNDEITVTATSINTVPVIDGQSPDPITINEDNDYTITFSNLDVIDDDNSNPADFTLSVGTDADYSLNIDGVTIEPALNFNGILTVPVTVNDGTDDSNEFDLEITVNAVNDPPTIDGVTVVNNHPDDEDIQPFIDIEIEDVDANDDLLATISFSPAVGEFSSLGGFIDNGNGAYEFTGSDTNIQNALRAIVFTPNENSSSGSTDVFFTINLKDQKAVDDDGPGVTDSNTKVTIIPQNDAPIVNLPSGNPNPFFDNATDIFPFNTASITDADNGGEQNVTVTITLNDAGNGRLESLPAGASIDVANGIYSFSGTPSQVTIQIRAITFNPDENEIPIGTTETTTFTVTVDDGTADFSDDVSVAVKPFNDEPEFTNSAPSFLLTEDNSNPATPAFSFDADAQDPDNAQNELTFSVSIEYDGNTFDENNLPDWLNFNTNTGELSGTPEDGDDGFYSVVISVTDGDNTVDQDDFAIFVQAENSIPVFTVPEDQTVGVNTTDELQITGIGVGSNDPNQEITEVIVTSDNQTLIPNANLSTDFNLANPNKTTIDLNYSTVNGQSGSAEISVTIRDNGTVNNETTKTFTIIVDDINTAPFIPDLSAGFDRDEDVNQAIEITGLTPGDNNQELVKELTTISSLNQNIIINPTVNLTGPNGANGYKVTINYELVENAFGTAQLSLRVQDNGSNLSGTNFKEVTFEVRVAPIDDVPVILGQKISLDISEGQRFSLNLNDFDIIHPANENETLTLNILAGNNYTVSATDEIIPDAGFNGTLQVNVTVSDEGDNNGNQVLTSNPPAVFSVNIDEINTAPEIVNQTPDTLSVREDDSFILTKSNLVIRDDNPSGDIFISEVRTRAGGNYTVNGTEIIPNDNFNGIISVPVIISDGDNTSDPYDVIIKVQSVNDAPQITGQFDIEIREEDTYEINLGDLNITDVDNGPEDFTLTIAEGLNYTIVEGTEIRANDNFFGTLTISVRVNDGSANSNVFDFEIEVLPVNDAPTINALADRTINDDNGQTLFVNFDNVTAGPNEAGQNITVTASSGNQSLIQTVEVIYTPNQSVGLLRMETIPERDGITTITVTVKDDGGTANGGTDTKVITFDVTVLGVNSAPTLDFISDINLLEDFEPTPVRLRNIRDGDDGDQEITITTTSSNPALIPDPTINYVQGETEGTLIYEPVPGQNGTATITVTVKDDGGTANGGEDTYQVTFEISILGLNDRPTVDAVADTSMLEDADDLIILLTGITDGDADEEQKMTITATSSRPEIIPDPEVIYDSVSTTAELTLVPAPNISGTTTITVTIQDDGGSIVRGQEDTRVISFEVRVIPVNDAPTINEITNTIRLLEGAEAQRQLLTGITDGDPELIQSITSVTVNTNKPDFYERLEIAYREGDTNGELILKTDPDANGMDTLTITVTDNGGTENGGFNTTTTTIFVDVLPLNDPPTINNPPNIDNILKNSEGDCITLSGIGDGDPELDQDVTITASSNRPDIIPDPIVSDFKPETGVATLCYEPMPDERGLVEITLTLKDDGGLPGNDTRSVTFTIGVGIINNPPVIIGEDGQPLEEVNLTTSKDVPLDICFQVIDRDRDEVDLGQIIARNADESGEIVAGSFTFKDDSLCFIYEAYPNTLSGEDWFEFTICDNVPGDVACDTIRLNIEILPSAELKIYDGISPMNPDGRNDAWFIEGIENYPDNIVQIYSPSGELVYEAEGYDNRDNLWRGESNTGIVLGARELPTGVYYYVIDLRDGAAPPLKGSVIIK